MILMQMADDYTWFRLYYGPEYISGALMDWTDKQNITMAYIQPGKPQQNAYIERYNRTVRYDWLTQYLFDTVIPPKNNGAQK